MLQGLIDEYQIFYCLLVRAFRCISGGQIF